MPTKSTLDKQLGKELDKKSPDVKILIDLLEKGASPVTQGEKTNLSVYDVACSQRDTTLIQFLIDQKLTSNRIAISQCIANRKITPEVATYLLKFDESFQSDADFFKNVLTAKQILDIELERPVPKIKNIYWLIDKTDVDLNYCHNNSSVLHILAYRGLDNEDVAKLFLRGMNFNTKINHKSVLHFAQFDHTKQILRKYGAREIHEPIPTLNDLLKDELNLGKNAEQEVIDNLMKRGATVDKATLNTLLNEQLEKRGNAEVKIVERLIKLGADFNLQGSKSGWSALHVAAKTSNQTLLTALLGKQGINLDCKTKNSESTPLATATNTQIVQRLVDAGADYQSDAHTINIPKTNSNRNEDKQLTRDKRSIYLKKELTKPPAAMDEVTIKACAGDLSLPIILLNTLSKHINEQITHLTQIHDKHGAADKLRLYQILNKDITELLKQGATNPSRIQTDAVKNMLMRTATISHHRRFRTWNKVQSFFTPWSDPKEANSWIAFKQMISDFQTANPLREKDTKTISDLKKDLQNSVNFNEQKLPCEVIGGTNNSQKRSVKGYEEYRDHSPKNFNP